MSTTNDLQAVSVCSGVGMTDIAAEQAGYALAAAAETEDFCQQVLRKRFPAARVLGDIRELNGTDLGTPALFTAGFPCQGISSAGKGEGLDDHRSALWFEVLRLIEECQPRIVLIENVAVLRSRGLDVVLRGLAHAGYGAWWDCVPALAAGAPHLRDRVWITAVHWYEMPDFSDQGKLIRDVPLGHKMPRAGASTLAGFLELKPEATIKMCKQAMGAVKREDGTTWLTRLNSPLFPTPSAVSYGSNQGGAAGRVGPVRHSLAQLAKLGLFPTPVAGVAAAEEQRSWPTPGARDYKDAGLHDGAIGRGQLPEAVRNSLRELKAEADQEVAAEEQRVWPTPSAATAEQGPGRSGRDGGPEIRTAVSETPASELESWPTPRASANELRTTKHAPSHGSTHGATLSGSDGARERADGREVPKGTQNAGPLNPYWVEWLMGVPIGWTDLEAGVVFQCDWLSEHGIPRVLRDVPHRKERLMALGNGLIWRVAYLRIMQAHRLLGIK